MSHVPKVSLFSQVHVKSMFIFVGGFAYVSIKMLEAFSPSALSEQDKLDSKYLQQQRLRGIVNPVYPEYTQPQVHAHGKHH